MEQPTRRRVVSAAALAGAAALTGLTQATTAQDAPKPPADDIAERQRMANCGLTEAETDCWLLISKAAGKFFELPKLHAMDDAEVAQAVHIVQNKLLSRPTYRKYLENAKAQKK